MKIITEIRKIFMAAIAVVSKNDIVRVILPYILLQPCDKSSYIRHGWMFKARRIYINVEGSARNHYEMLSTNVALVPYLFLLYHILITRNNFWLDTFWHMLPLLEALWRKNFDQKLFDTDSLSVYYVMWLSSFTWISVLSKLYKCWLTEVSSIIYIAY